MSGREAERIVVALDAVSESAAAIAAAARIAARWKLPLHGLFIEDDDLIRLAHLPFARDVTLSLGVEPFSLRQAEHQLRVFAERARRELAAAAAAHGIEWSFEIARSGHAGSGAAGVASGFVVAAIATRPVGGHFRVECRWWSVVEGGASPMLLARPTAPPPAATVALLHATDPGGERLIAAAARFAAARDEPLVVLCEPRLSETSGFREWLDRLTAGNGIRARVETASGDPAALLARLAAIGGSAIALSAAGPEAQPARLRELAAGLACDILVVR